MTIELKPTKSFVYNEQKLINDKIKVICFPCGSTGGAYNHNIGISFEAENEDNEAYVSIYLNKNHALYLANVLLAFINEKDININDED
jgi:hypothetical protein